MPDHILVSDDKFVRTIQFNRPEKKNAIHHAMYAKITKAMRDGDDDPDIRVIVFGAVLDNYSRTTELT